VECQLGLVDLHGNPRFGCYDVGGQGISSAGGYLNTSERGCPSGLFACPSSGVCVSSCKFCLGHKLQQKGICAPEKEPNMEDLAACPPFCRRLTTNTTLMCERWKKCHGCEECGMQQQQSEEQAEAVLSSEFGSLGSEQESHLLEEMSMLQQSEEHTEALLSSALAGSYFLWPTENADDSEKLALHGQFSEAAMLVDQNKEHIQTPQSGACDLLLETFLQVVCDCTSENPEECEEALNTCMAKSSCRPSNTDGNQCECVYDPKEIIPTCEDWFKAEDHLVPILGDQGLALLTQKDCTCSDGKCSFSMLTRLPKVRIFQDDLLAINFNNLLNPKIS